jgi:hypothetical protein
VELEDLPEGIWASGHVDYDCAHVLIGTSDWRRYFRRDGVPVLGIVERIRWTAGVIARQGKAIRLYFYENEDLGLGYGSGS